MQFVFSARVQLSGCQIIVNADTEKEAREKITQGGWEEIETFTGELVNWSVTRLLSQSPD